jgi:DNA-binding LacI/PurR family transcriptional regulator
MAVSAKDIARVAGVSQQTVSSVMNNKTNARISTVTQELVRKTAAEMGYRPNHLARSLVRKKTDTIGVMISQLDNPFFVQVLSSAEAVVTSSGYKLILDVSATGFSSYHELSEVSSWLVDGVLMWSSTFVNLATYLGDRSRDLPVVYMGHLRNDNSDAVAMDLYDAGKQATEYAVDRGYRRPCFVSHYELERIVDPGGSLRRDVQLAAYADVCRQAGLEPEVCVIDEGKSEAYHAGLAIAARERSTRPDVLICQNDWIALMVNSGLRHGGLRVPDDVGLIGFDGIEVGRYMADAPLTTVPMPNELLCRTAFDILRGRIAGDTDSPPRQVLIPVELAVGGTTK